MAEPHADFENLIVFDHIEFTTVLRDPEPDSDHTTVSQLGRYCYNLAKRFTFCGDKIVSGYSGH